MEGLPKSNYMIFHQFKNVRTNLGEEIQRYALLEMAYLGKVFTFIKEELGAQAFAELDIVVVFYDVKQEIPPAKRNKNGIYFVFDEQANYHSELSESGYLLFQAYGAEKKYAHKNVFPFPLGFNGNINFKPVKPILERDLNVFFSGNLHKGREGFYNYFGLFKSIPFALQHRLQGFLKKSYHKKYPSSFIQFTNGFSKGLSEEKYAQFLSDSRIVLAPPGSQNVECFRHYEAMRQGCIVISEKLPGNFIFKGSPVVQIDTWAEGNDVINYLLQHEHEMVKIHHATLKWWHEVLSEKAVAKYVSEKIQIFLTDY